MASLAGNGTNVFSSSNTVDVPVLLWSGTLPGIYTVNINSTTTTAGTGDGWLDFYLARGTAATDFPLGTGQDAGQWTIASAYEDNADFTSGNYISPFPDPIGDLNLYGVVRNAALTVNVSVEFLVTKLASITA